MKRVIIFMKINREENIKDKRHTNSLIRTSGVDSPSTSPS